MMKWKVSSSRAGSLMMALLLEICGALVWPPDSEEILSIRQWQSQSRSY
jgi:hypothetical protein